MEVMQHTCLHEPKGSERTALMGGKSMEGRCGSVESIKPPIVSRL